MEILIAFVVICILLVAGYGLGRLNKNDHIEEDVKQSVIKRLGHVPVNKIETATVYVKFDKYGVVEEYSFDPLLPTPETPQNPWAS